MLYIVLVSTSVAWLILMIVHFTISFAWGGGGVAGGSVGGPQGAVEGNLVVGWGGSALDMRTIYPSHTKHGSLSIHKPLSYTLLGIFQVRV